MLDADVIVIGGGLAGLTAAHYILQKEPTLVVIVLESSNGVGGKLAQVPLFVRSGSSISYFDITGGWIGKKQIHLCSLLEELDVPLKSNNNSGKIIVELKNTHFFQNRNDILKVLSGLEKIELTTFIIKVESLCHKLLIDGDFKFVNELSATTLKDFINKHVKRERVAIVIDYIVRLNCGSSTSDMSVLFYMYFCISTKGIKNQIFMNDNDIHEFRMKNSKHSVISKLADDIGETFILKGEHVDTIICKKDCIYIRTKSRWYSCNSTILAIPPKQILNIEITPELPKSKINAFKNTFANTVTIFIATYPKEFWTKRGYSGEVFVFDKRFPRGPIDYCGNISGPQTPALQGRIFSRREVTNDEVSRYKEEVLKQLSEYFGEEALDPTDYYEKSWAEDPLMLCWKTYNTEYFKHMTDSFERIYFAGAEMSQQWYGYMAGAVHSGIRAALEVLSDIRPSVLTLDDYIFLNPARAVYLHSSSESTNPLLYSILKKWKQYTTIISLILLVLWILKRK